MLANDNDAFLLDFLLAATLGLVDPGDKVRLITTTLQHGMDSLCNERVTSTERTMQSQKREKKKNKREFKHKCDCFKTSTI
jgi:hypothetical protein